MSCQKCDEFDDKGQVAYYRLGRANVGLVGCDEHLNQIMKALDGAEREDDRVVYRVSRYQPSPEPPEAAAPASGRTLGTGSPTEPPPAA
jgi:hypothetical protein